MGEAEETVELLYSTVVRVDSHQPFYKRESLSVSSAAEKILGDYFKEMLFEFRQASKMDFFDNNQNLIIFNATSDKTTFFLAYHDVVSDILFRSSKYENSALLEERCIARVDEESSRLVRTGRDNMPGDELDDMTATGAYLDIAAPIRP